ncbi:hypothetical protein QOT17_008680 [Balamuthia mandrillaris]
MGLCAGDRNGGPVRTFFLKTFLSLRILINCLLVFRVGAGMAVRLAESLIEKQTYDREDVIRRYHAWYKGPPYDTGTSTHNKSIVRCYFFLIHQHQKQTPPWRSSSSSLLMTHSMTSGRPALAATTCTSSGNETRPSL